MNILLKALAIGAACLLGAGAAHAQSQGAPLSGPGSTIYDNPGAKLSGDTNDRDAARAREDELDRLRNKRVEKAKTIRSVPAKPNDVVVGAEVRDKLGVRVGTIESVGVAAAVLKAEGGAVEVPLEAFGKDANGLLIGLIKAEFDALVASATKPGG